MEKTYKILKALAAVLLVCVVAAGVWALMPGQVQEPAVTEPADVPTTEAAVQTVPDFTVYDREGNAHKLSDFRGKPVILNFWASWCGPCKGEMPEFQQFYETYGEQIHFLVVNLTDGVQETVETASGYIAEQGYSFPVYYDTTMEAATVYGIRAIPATFFIDAEGVLAASETGALSAERLQAGVDLIFTEE